MWKGFFSKSQSKRDSEGGDNEMGFLQNYCMAMKDSRSEVKEQS